MAADLSREQDAARKQVMESEQEIQSIKNQLRRLQNAAGDNADGPNSIEICWLKVRLDGLRMNLSPFLLSTKLSHTFCIPFAFCLRLCVCVCVCVIIVE